MRSNRRALLDSANYGREKDDRSAEVLVTLGEIVTSIISSGLLIAFLVAIAYYLRDQLTAYFQNRLKHNFDKQIETLRSELERDREAVNSLRVGALGVRAQRQSIIDQRRVEAVDQLWAAVKELNKLRWISNAMAAIKWPEAAEMAKKDIRAQKVFDLLSGTNGKNMDIQHNAHAARPYVSPLAWALFSTMQTVLSYSLMQMTILRTGVGPEFIAEDKKIFAPIIAALPEYRSLIEQFGHTAFPQIADTLESRILMELQNTLIGREADAEEVRRASEIEKLVQEAKPGTGNTPV